MRYIPFWASTQEPRSCYGLGSGSNFQLCVVKTVNGNYVYYHTVAATICTKILTFFGAKMIFFSSPTFIGYWNNFRKCKFVPCYISIRHPLKNIKGLSFAWYFNTHKCWWMDKMMMMIRCAPEHYLSCWSWIFKNKKVKLHACGENFDCNSDENWKWTLHVRWYGMGREVGVIIPACGVILAYHEQGKRHTCKVRKYAEIIHCTS